MSLRVAPAQKGPVVLQGVAIVSLSAVMAALVLLMNGNAILAVALVFGLAGFTLMLVRPDYCFAFFIFAAMVFEQFQIFGLEQPVTLKVMFFENFNNSLGIPVPTNPVVMLLALMAGSWLIKRLALRHLDVQPIRMWWPPLLYGGALLLFSVYGFLRGGDIMIALWEIRALMYMLVTYFVGSQIIRTDPQIRLVIWALLAGIAIKGFQGIWRYVVDLGGSLGDIEAITGHEDAVFMATVFVLSLCLWLFKGPRNMLMFQLVTFPSTFLTFLFAQRRVAYGALAFGMIIVFGYIPAKTRKWVLTHVMIPAIPLVALYAGAFWNSGSGLAMPIRQVKEIFETGEENRSNLYRDIEKINLIATIRESPQGVGFGKKYKIVVPLDAVDFPLWEYIPHNCILWMWCKMGFLGYWTFWIFLGLLIVQLTIDFRHTKDPLYRSVQVMTIVFIVNQLIVANYDLQLTFYRNMMYFGGMFALCVPIRILGGAAAAEQRINDGIGDGIGDGLVIEAEVLKQIEADVPNQEDLP